MIGRKLRICANLGVGEITQEACVESEEYGGQNAGIDQFLGVVRNRRKTCRMIFLKPRKEV